MKVLITGSSGQLGHALKLSFPRNYELIAYTSSEFDLTNYSSCYELIMLHKPDWVFNTGAYTAVDKAESESELAQSINGEGPKVIADALLKTGGRILQISTDFVFGGHQSFPYSPNQKLDPLGVYGKTKAAGEEAICRILGKRAYVIRTSWLYGPVGRNFFLTMLNLHRSKGLNGESISVVADQISCPTSTFSLALACWRLLEIANTDISQLLPNIHHWTDGGVASWYDFATLIGEIGVKKGLIEKAASVRPIRTIDYPTPASRPSYSLLDCTQTRQVLNLQPLHWIQSLEEVFKTFEN